MMGEEIIELKKRFCKDGISQDEAFNKAYADMSRRATGHKPEYKDVNKVYFNSCLAKLKTIDLKRQEDFDNWFKETCDNWKTSLKNANSFMTLGRKQKVINMFFKYLSYAKNKKEYGNVYRWCHMTLDGYTLEWYQQKIGKIATKEWSKINKWDEYINYQRKIKEYLGSSQTYSFTELDSFQNINSNCSKKIKLPKTSFDAEFIIWEGEIVKEKYCQMVSSLEAYLSADVKKRQHESWRNKDAWLIGNLFDNYLKECINRL